MKQVTTDTLLSAFEVPPSKYYFIRTDSGVNFNAYYDNNFVGIGWPSVSIAETREIERFSETIRGRLERSEEYHMRHYKKTSSRDGAISMVLGKLKAFRDLKKGDVIIIPSENSWELAFGIIDDDQLYFKEDQNSSNFKRRKVKWIVRDETRNLDAKFLYVKKSFHAISEIDSEFYTLINNVMFDSYITPEGISNISLKLLKDGNIEFLELSKFLNTLVEIANKYNSKNNLELSKTEIKINLQSKGFVNLSQNSKGILFALGVLMVACSEQPESNNEDRYGSMNTVLEKYEIPKEDVDILVQGADSLEYKYR